MGAVLCQPTRSQPEATINRADVAYLHSSHLRIQSKSFHRSLPIIYFVSFVPAFIGDHLWYDVLYCY